MLVLVCVLATPALAQPVPDEGMGALGGELGVFLPDEQFESALMLGGTLDYYINPRVGVRGQLGWANPNFENSGDSLRHTWLTGNVHYNWEGGAWHPFVTGGLGLYFLSLDLDGRDEDFDETKFGVNLGGGVEYFTGAMTTLKMEGAYHFIGDDDLPWEPSGLTLSIGLKRYF